jgi:hypothetical protein
MFPIRTAREYPTIGSHGAPLEMFCLGIPFSSERISKHNPIAAITTLAAASFRSLLDDAKLNAIRRRTRDD